MNAKLEDPRKQEIADLIRTELGIIYNKDNEFQLDSRLAEIMKSLGIDRFEQLHEKLKEDYSVRRKIIRLAINNETSFFRDPKVFSGFADLLLPEVVSRLAPADPLRIWSAASSFGQEPYTLSMILNEKAEVSPNFPMFEILATDVSEEALQRAKDGEYSQLEIGRGLTEQLKKKYFDSKDGGMWKVKDSIKSGLSFKLYNLLDPCPFESQFQIVFCRNVLIYQENDKKREILERITQRIVPRGYLVMGSTESLIGLSDDYQQVVHEGAVFYQKNA